MKRISLLLFFIGCFLFSLSATNYFVATNGSDSNSGTIDKPFATLDKAQSKVMAGDTVYIRQGTYRVTEAEIMEHYTAGSTTWSRVFKMSKSGTGPDKRICVLCKWLLFAFQKYRGGGNTSNYCGTYPVRMFPQ